MPSTLQKCKVLFNVICNFAAVKYKNENTGQVRVLGAKG